MIASLNLVRSRPPAVPRIGTFTRDQMEQRRLQAADLFAAGKPQSAAVRQFQVSRTTASRWARKLQEQGREALRKRRGTGRPRKLTPVQQEGLWAIYRDQPDDTWTCYRLAEVILDHFAVRYHTDHAGRILLGLRQRAQGAPR